LSDQDPQLDDLLQHGFRYALSLTHQRSKAEDLLQEACMSISKRGGPWQKGYLFTSIRNAWIDQYRSEQLKPLAYLGEDGVLYQREADAHLETDRLEEQEDVDQLLSRLKPEDRELLYLSAVEGYSASEIAEQTGTSRNTILSRLHRAKGQLKDWLSSRKERSA